MPVAKLCTTGTLDPMRTSDGNEGIDTYGRQSIGKEPLLSFSRSGDSPVQWIQLLHALDQQELPGWPLLTPLKVQMQKCEKCSREFCSPINYRRHIRVHRRSLNVDKESHKIRDILAAFWDKLSLEEAKEVVSINDVMLKEVPGLSVSKALAASLRKPGVWTLPQVYVKAGTTLLDIIHAKPSRLPISSQELFSILDDASERTFLCAGTAESVQKYVFDGEAGKVAFELKNLVSCTCFLFELKLLKAWLTDKDAEALRCQKLLVEEEEAAQKRQAEILERKKQKKLRQKEQKAREQSNEENAVSSSVDSLEESILAETYSPTTLPEIVADAPEILLDITSCPDLVQFSNNEQNDDIEAQHDSNNGYVDNVEVQNVEQPMVSVNVRRRWQAPKSQRIVRNGFHHGGNYNLQLKPEPPVQKHAPLKDRGALVNNSKVWTKKFKVENDEDSLRPRSEEQQKLNQMDEKKCELMIGSISVPVRNCFSKKKSLVLGEARCGESKVLGKHKNGNYEEEPDNNDNLQNGINLAAALHCRPVSRHETRGSVPVLRRCSEKSLTHEKLDDRTASDGCCLQSSAVDDDCSKSRECFDYPMEGAAVPSQFSSTAAKAFLAQRWKEAISSDHVTLVLCGEPEPPGGTQTQNDFLIAVSVASDIRENSVLHDVENQVSVVDPYSSNSRNAKGKVRKSPDKGVKINYIPKQKVAA